MVEQKVIMDLQDEGGNELGTLTISAIHETLKNPKSFKVDCMDFENISVVEKPDDRTPIQYHSGNDGPSRLMLLEETKYQVLFETSLQFKE